MLNKGMSGFTSNTLMILKQDLLMIFMFAILPSGLGDFSELHDQIKVQIMQ